MGNKGINAVIIFVLAILVAVFVFYPWVVTVLWWLQGPLIAAYWTLIGMVMGRTLA